ncbi:ATP-grasp domain-containing protein [Halospina sp. K52047b]|uniref:ATP-grasp domain-containing protein n=1 Tax=Halospina sp. K52047b TaxID=2614160 RepID=UPI001249FD61|nr:ATP-grasp domain-containing protein [Halospina sp. K52047b]KAA8984542.1 ATP-grasp domain-containing protein [Halospina sp. K52047b]
MSSESPRDNAVKQVYVLGMNEFNRAKLESLPGADHYRFHGVLTPEEILYADDFPIESMLSRAEKQLQEADPAPDAIVGYMDFPVSTILPILTGRLGLPGLDLRAMLKCEHKYWSRLEQQAVVPDFIPRFQLVDPFLDSPETQLELEYPFWLKPVKSAGSYLGFRIDDEAAFHRAVAEIREHINRIAEPFDRILEYIELPDNIAAVGGHYCLAEALLTGDMCTLEGYVHQGEVHVHGVVDSVREANSSSFARYQYPSQMPQSVTERMEEVARKTLQRIGFDGSAFNIEFFWDSSTDKVSLLEINTRIAQHHSDLFDKVHGVSNHQVAVELALGHNPKFPAARGRFNCAAAFWLRRHEDAWVADVPSGQTLAAIAEEYPGTYVELDVHPGMWLSELHDQDSYSYVLALIYVGADTHEQLMANHSAIVERLSFDLRDGPDR